MERPRLPFSRRDIKAAENAVASAPKGTTGYPLDGSLRRLSEMQRANAAYRAAKNPGK